MSRTGKAWVSRASVHCAPVPPCYGLEAFKVSHGKGDRVIH